METQAKATKHVRHLSFPLLPQCLLPFLQIVQRVNELSGAIEGETMRVSSLPYPSLVTFSDVLR